MFIWAGPAGRSTHSKTTQAGTLSLLMLLRLALLVALTLVSLACCHCIYPRRDLRPLHMCIVSILRLRATSTGRKCGVGGGCCQSRLHAVLQQSGKMAWVQDLRSSELRIVGSVNLPMKRAHAKVERQGVSWCRVLRCERASLQCLRPPKVDCAASLGA